jgi:uncharacterized repeat protein (TIGR01451 family)
MDEDHQRASWALTVKGHGERKQKEREKRKKVSKAKRFCLVGVAALVPIAVLFILGVVLRGVPVVAEAPVVQAASLPVQVSFVSRTLSTHSYKWGQAGSPVIAGKLAAWLKERPSDREVVEIFDLQGQEVATYERRAGSGAEQPSIGLFGDEGVPYLGLSGYGVEILSRDGISWQEVFSMTNGSYIRAAPEAGAFWWQQWFGDRYGPVVWTPTGVYPRYGWVDDITWRDGQWWLLDGRWLYSGDSLDQLSLVHTFSLDVKEGTFSEEGPLAVLLAEWVSTQSSAWTELWVADLASGWQLQRLTDNAAEMIDGGIWFSDTVAVALYYRWVSGQAELAVRPVGQGWQRIVLSGVDIDYRVDAQVGPNGAELVWADRLGDRETLLYGLAIWELPPPPEPALEVSKSVYPDPVQAGEPITYTIQVTNTGNITLTVTITDFPQGSRPVEGWDYALAEFGWAGRRQYLRWSDVTLGVSETWLVSFPMLSLPGYSGTLTNTVEVSTDQGVTGTAIVTSTSVYTPTVYQVFMPVVGRNFCPDPCISTWPRGELYGRFEVDLPSRASGHFWLENRGTKSFSFTVSHEGDFMADFDFEDSPGLVKPGGLVFVEFWWELAGLSIGEYYGVIHIHDAETEVVVWKLPVRLELVPRDLGPTPTPPAIVTPTSTRIVLLTPTPTGTPTRALPFPTPTPTPTASPSQ